MEEVVQSQSAVIIAFPAPVISPQERLARALAKLDAALTEQREAVKRWRDNMAELRDTMSQLGDSVQTLNGSLATLGERNAAVRADALKLEAWADAALAQAASGG